jgi:hypothetical protein
VQVIEQRLRLLQIERVETLSETYANQSERLARLPGFALIAPGAKAMFGRDLIEARADDRREAAERQGSETRKETETGAPPTRCTDCDRLAEVVKRFNIEPSDELLGARWTVSKIVL